MKLVTALSCLAAIIWIEALSRQLQSSQTAYYEVQKEQLLLESRVKRLRDTNNLLINDIKELVDLAGVSIADCTPSSERWFNYDFGFPVAGYKRIISADLIRERLTAEGSAVAPDRFELIFDRNALSSQYHLIKDISITTEEDRISLAYHPSSKDVTAIDFLILAFNDSTPVCSKKVTLQFAPKTPEGEWHAELVIGRGGIKAGALS